MVGHIECMENWEIHKTFWPNQHLGHLDEWRILERIWTIGGEHVAQNSPPGFCEHDIASSNAVKPESILTIKSLWRPNTRFKLSGIWVHIFLEATFPLKTGVFYDMMSPFQTRIDKWSNLWKLPTRRRISHTYPMWLWGHSLFKILSPGPVFYGTKWLLWHPHN
jgi:hypothetical protein